MSAAQRGWRVHAIDTSVAGRDKARAMARSRAVEITHDHGEPRSHFERSQVVDVERREVDLEEGRYRRGSSCVTRLRCEACRPPARQR